MQPAAHPDQCQGPSGGRTDRIAFRDIPLTRPEGTVPTLLERALDPMQEDSPLNQLRNQLGDRYAGMWWTGDTTLTIAAAPLHPADQAFLDQLGHPLAPAVTLTEVPYTRAQLELWRDGLTDQLRSKSVSGDFQGAYSVAVDVRAGKIDIGAEGLSPAGWSELTSSLPSGVWRASPVQTATAGDSRREFPYKAGRVVGVSECTSNFIFRDPSRPTVNYFSTAGHCRSLGESIELQRGKDTPFEYLGTVDRNGWEEGWNANRFVWLDLALAASNGAGDYANHLTYINPKLSRQVYGLIPEAVIDRQSEICISPRSSPDRSYCTTHGWESWSTTINYGGRQASALKVTFWQERDPSGNLTKSSFCPEHSDSGSPIFVVDALDTPTAETRYAQAVGVWVAFAGCTSYWQPVSRATQHLSPYAVALDPKPRFECPDRYSYLCREFPR